MPAERVLVTGAGGFVGRHVAAALAAAGCEVHALARTAPGTSVAGVRWHVEDLLAPGRAEAIVRGLRPAVLVHTAWYARHGLFWTAPENELWVTATLDLARGLAEAGGRRFVGVGSCAEYDWTLPGDAPWPEHRPLAPATAYGQAKCRAAEGVRAACAAAGISFAWTRLFLLFGTDEQPGRLVPSVATALLQGREARTGSGRHVRDFCDSGWAGRAIAAVALSGVAGPVNIGSGVPLSIASLVDRLARLCGRPELLRPGALPDRPEDPPFMVPDVRRLQGEAGFDAPFDLDAALARTIADLRRRL